MYKFCIIHQDKMILKCDLAVIWNDILAISF